MAHYVDTGLPQTYRSCFNEGGSNAAKGHEEDGYSIVVVFVQGPEYQTGNLKDVKGVKDLLRLARLWFTRDPSTYLVHKEARHGLLLNVDVIPAKDHIAVALLFAVDAGANGANV